MQERKGWVTVKEDLVENLLKENAELRAENEFLKKLVLELQNTIVQLKERIAFLERQLKINSHTSSKPPSSDGLKKEPRVRSLREKGQKKSGGQKGHKGHTLQQVENPDEIISIPLNECPMCTTDIREASVISIVKRQIFDIPIPKVIIQEYQAETKECPCCKKNVTASFPKNVQAPVQYGERTQALAIYLSYQQLLPSDRLQTLFEDVFKLPISEATINKIGLSFSNNLTAFVDEIEQYLRGSPVKHVDETGMRIASKTHWLHVLCNDQATHYRPSEKRKAIFEDLTGFVVHDHFRPYYNMLDAEHILCNAHHLRELKALIEIDKEEWAEKISDILKIGNQLKIIFEGEIPELMIAILSILYDHYVTEGFNYHESLKPLEHGIMGRKKRRPGHNLLMRLRKYKDGILRYLYEEDVPFTNNQAEQDIRMMKVKQKISGGFRTMQGAQIFCKIRSFLSTVRKRGYNLLDSITQFVNKKQFLTLETFN